MTELLTPDELSPTQAEMLACGEFHVDGSMRPAGIEAAAALECKGFATSTIGGDSQYTAINYTVTESGKDALIAYVKAQAAKLAKVRKLRDYYDAETKRDYTNEYKILARKFSNDLTAILEERTS